MIAEQNDPKTQILQDSLRDLLDQHGSIFWDAVFGLCDPHFGHCTCGRHPVHMSVGKTDFMVCMQCRTYWCVGENLSSRYGDHYTDTKTIAFLKTCREIEPVYPWALFGNTGLLTGDQIHSAINAFRTEINALRTRLPDAVPTDDIPF